MSSRTQPLRALVALALALVAVPVLTVDAQAAATTVTSLTSEGFTGRTTADASWYRLATAANDACLTAGTSTASRPIPACQSTAIDSGPGTLRLTASAGNQVGTVYSTTSLPTSQGLDVQFSTYQWSSGTDKDGKVAVGADGINFILAATDPTNPAPPSSTGPTGGSLGYSANSKSGVVAGVTNGYLGFGLDVFGNYRSSVFGGSGCSDSSSASAQNVTVRGPGNGTVGYCIAGTRQVSPGLLDAPAATSRPAAVPVEVALNPATSATTSLGGVSIPARSWLIAYTPIGGSQQTLTGALPTGAALASYGYPASYYDPATGLPYQLTFGWAASTGGNKEFHEINNLASSTLNGQLPDLNVALGDNQGAAFLAGSAATVSVTPSLDATQGPENRVPTVTTTFPAGLTPGNPTTTDYACTTAGQVVSCTYPTVPVAAGTSLPTLTIPVQVGSSPATGLTITAKASSTDANPGQATRTVSIVGFGASATPARVAYGTAATLSSTGLPGGATGTVTFTSGAATLCTAVLPSVSCTGPTTLAPGTYAITAAYSGDVGFAARTATTSLTVTRAAPVLSASVSDATTSYGTPDTLSFSGVPVGATGSVTFASRGSVLCTVGDVTRATSCPTATGLDVGSYPVTATYSGDPNFASATATTSFSVAKAAVDLRAAVSQATVAYGTGDTLSAGGLPGDATGSVRFTAADGSLLCAIDDVAAASSCPISPETDTGAYVVSAEYSGDRHYARAQATTGFDVVPADTALVAAVSDPSVPFGTSSALSFSGLPAGVTGTVTFTSEGRTLCTVDVTEASSCASPTDLEAGTYVVTATYSGDANHRGAQDQTRLRITARGSASFTASASDPAPTYGTADTLAFSGLADGATGSVTFRAGGRTLCSVDDVTTSSSCTTDDDLDAGAYEVTATYSGDRNHDPSSATADFRVVPADTQVSATVAADPLAYGLAQTLSFGGLPEAATGSVTFSAGGRTLCAVADVSEATSCASEEVLAAGEYAVVATYSGDDNHRGSSATTSFTVEQAGVDLTAGVSDAEVPYGTAETLSFGGVPPEAGGTVTFTSGGRALCTVDSVRAAASCPAPADLEVGTYAVTASYSGDPDHAAASATTTFRVVRAATSLSASVGQARVPWSRGETFTFGGLPAGATGSVVFASGGDPLCTVDDVSVATGCSGGVALPTGVYPVTATYSGDPRHAGSRATTTFTVVRAEPPFSATAVSGAVAYGSANTLTFSNLPPSATGSVTFTAGGRTLCTVADLTVTDRCTTPADLGAGSYPIVATYSGDERFLSVTTGTGYTVTPAPTPLVVSPRTAQVDHGASQVLTATLPAGATGTVTFTSGDRALCTVDLAKGRSCATGTDLPVGRYPVLGVYSGDANHQPAEATTTFDVVRVVVAGFGAAVDPTRTPYGTPVALSFSGLPAGATGTVRFDVDLGSTRARAGEQLLCSVVVGDAESCSSPSSLEPGTYPVLATYSGDSNHEGATTRLEFVVEKAATQVDAVAGGAAAAGDAVVLTVSSLPDGATGTVVLSTGGTVLCTVVLPARSCTTTALAAGTQTVLAEYSGDARYRASATTFDVEVAEDEPDGSGDGNGSGDSPTHSSSSHAHHPQTDQDRALANTGGPGLALLVGGLVLLSGGSVALAVGRRRSRTGP